MQKRCFLLLVALAGITCARQQDPLAPDAGRTVMTRYHGEGSVDVYGSVDPSRHILRAPVDSVWVVLPAVYEQLEIEPTLVDRRGYQIGNTRFLPRQIDGKRLSGFLQCGYSVTSANNADTYRVTMSVMTRVRVDEEGQTLLQTEVSASAKPREVSGNDVNCSTTGRLERTIAELAAAFADGGNPPGS